jgi:hypothetical protein
MKIAACLLLLSLSLQFVLAQQHRTFFRIYNADGKKIGKGFIYNMTDTSILLTKKRSSERFTEIPAALIDIIKSRHSTAHRILITSLKAIGVVTLVGIAVIYVVKSANHPHYSQNSINNKGGETQSSGSVDIKPLKKYKVGGSIAQWKTQQLLLLPLM